MITATAGELADLLEDDRRESFRCRIADHTDTLQDVSDDVLSLSVTIDVNQPSRSANISLKLGDHSPFLSNPTVYPRRRVVIDMEVRRHDEALGSSWIEVFNGFLNVPVLNAKQDTVTLPCQDHWLILYNKLIESEASYGSGGGVAIETVLQQIEAANTNAYTISVSGTPTTTIKTFTQRRMKLSQALVDVANVNAWDLRFFGTTLTFQEPPRSKTTPDYTFTTDGFFDVPYAALDPTGIVNRVLGQWDDSNTEVAEDSTSVSAWGELAAYIDARQDPQFTSAPTMQALLDIIVTDRANPLTVWQVKGRLFPFAEIWDLYRFPALTDITSGNTDLAVSKVVHSFPGFGQMPHTMLHLAGSPSGGVDRWDRLITKTTRAQIVTDVTGPVVAGIVPPTISVEVDQTGSTGTLDIVLHDPDGLIDATAFKPQAGGSDFDFTDDPTGWDVYDDTAATLGDTVGLVEGHDSYIAFAYRWNPGTGARWERDFRSFDKDRIPDLSCALNRLGATVRLSHSGKEDLNSIRYSTSKVDAATALAGVAAGTVVSGRTGDTEIEASMAAGDTLFVAVRGFNGSSGDSTASTEDWEGRIGDAVGADGITQAMLGDAIVGAAQMKKQEQFFGSSVAFSSGSYTNLAWAAGTLYFGDGTTASINSSSISLTAGGAPRYIYYDGTANLQNTTAITTVLGDESYLLLCTAWASDSNHDDAAFVPAFGAMGVGKVSITAGQISAGSIATGHLQANSVTAGKITVLTLSAIVADFGTVTAGLINNATSNPTAGIRVDTGYSKPGTWTSYIDLAATTTDPFIKGTEFEMLANGDATFSGTVAAGTFTASRADFSGTINAHGGGGTAVIATDHIYQTASSTSVSLVGGQIRFGTTFEFYEPGISATVAIAIENGPKLGFFGVTPVVKPTVTGSRGGNAALTSALTALANLGLITDSST